jgi:hypothetical protein
MGATGPDGGAGCQRCCSAGGCAGGLGEWEIDRKEGPEGVLSVVGATVCLHDDQRTPLPPCAQQA